MTASSSIDAGADMRPVPSAQHRWKLLGSMQVLAALLEQRLGSGSPALSSTHWAILEEAAGSRQGVSQIHLADRLGLCGSSITRAIDALEARDLVQRGVGHFDRRVRAVTLTAAGRMVLDQRQAATDGLASMLLEHEDRSQVQAFQFLLQRLHDRLASF